MINFIYKPCFNITDMQMTRHKWRESHYNTDTVGKNDITHLQTLDPQFTSTFTLISVQTNIKPWKGNRRLRTCQNLLIYNAHCNGNSDKWNILDYIDVLLLWKSIGLHVLAGDANALYPCTPIRPVLWPGDLVIGPWTLKIIRALYSAMMYLCMKFCEAMSKHSWLKRDNFI